MATVHRIIHENLSMRKISAKFVPSVLNDELKERCVGDNRKMIEHITFNLRVLESLTRVGFIFIRRRWRRPISSARYW